MPGAKKRLRAATFLPAAGAATACECTFATGHRVQCSPSSRGIERTQAYMVSSDRTTHSLTLTHTLALSLRSFIERTHAYMVLLDCATHSLGVPAGGRAERLLDAARRAGECVWRLGLLHKGPGLCHGISGGGFSLLALHRDDPESRRGLFCSVLSFCSLTTASVVV
jgi:hypothetical protein